MSTASVSSREHRPAPRDPEHALIRKLEERFRKVSELLYDTRVPADVLDEEVMPFVADDVTFVDPWQTGTGRDVYREGLAAFHNMLRFDLDITQVNIQLEPGGRKGRAMVDSVMNLRQFSWLYVYPLRTFLVYEFTLEGEGEHAEPRIHKHEEMWSIGDMIEAVPGIGPLYAKVFRNVFRKGFLAAGAFKAWRMARH